MFNVDLLLRLNAVCEALAGFPGAPRTQGQIARTLDLDPGNFNHMLMGRRPITTATLARLHQVLRLEALGLPFEPAFWRTLPPSNVAAMVKAARGGDVVDAISARLTPSPFFDFISEPGTALIFADHPPDARPWPAILQRPAVVGTPLFVEITPPMNGVLKLVCLEGGEAIGLDGYFGLIHQRFYQGVRKRLVPSFSVRRNPPEALFVALLSEQPLSSNWPTRDSSSARISPRAFAELVRATLVGNPDIRLAAIRLFAV